MQAGLLGAHARAHAKVHQTPLEPSLVHPVGHLCIVGIGHQQGQAKVVQQALDGAFPVALVVADFQQFAHKGHAVFAQAQCSA